MTGPSVFALQVAWHAVAIGVLAFAAAYLIVETQFYATALLVVGGAVLFVVDLLRVVSQVDRTLERFLEGLTSGASDIPSRNDSAFVRLSQAIGRTARSLDVARTKREREIAYLQSLLDTVSAALFVVDTDGRPRPVNRAAHALTKWPVTRLNEIDALGNESAAALSALAPGARKILRLANGQQVLAAAVQFSTPGAEPQRLLSLQRIAGELDAVELKAWQDVTRVLAHEMMNSLTPIASLSDSLEALLRVDPRNGDDRSASDFASAVEAIKRRSIGLMSFVERYRQVAELPKPDLRIIRVGDLVDGIERLMRPVCAEKRIEFKATTKSDMTLAGDPQLLEHAIINLIRNAFDAVAGAERPRIDLSCGVSDGYVVVSVADNGAGLPQNAIDEIFIPFFTTKAGGSGIGLSLVRQIALAHGGRVEVQNAEPSGAVFRLILPAPAG